MGTLHKLRNSLLGTLNDLGVSRRVGASEWRRRRLLILGYHGVSLEDEHEWDPELYVSPSFLRRRFELLREHGATVLPLSTALGLMQAGNLPPRAVVLTFDDGMHDFYVHALPLLQEFGYPATVYLTSYYGIRQMAVTPIMWRYLLWKGRHEALQPWPEIGLAEVKRLATGTARSAVLRLLQERAESDGMSGADRDVLGAELARRLGLDYQAMRRRQLLHVMNTAEVGAVSAAGIEVQLHTHRHRTPRDQGLFVRELQDNAREITRLTGTVPQHFCYPSGQYAPEFPSWLAGAGVLSATTCDVGLVDPATDPFFLPRFIDTSLQPEVTFASWVNGVADRLARHRPLGVVS